jgi:hypothetical protein
MFVDCDAADDRKENQQSNKHPKENHYFFLPLQSRAARVPVAPWSTRLEKVDTNTKWRE